MESIEFSHGAAAEHPEGGDHTTVQARRAERFYTVQPFEQRKVGLVECFLEK